MNSSYKPLLMPTIGGRGQRRRRWRDALLISLGVLLVLVIYYASRPRVAPRPIANLQKNGVHGAYNVRSQKGELLLYNFREIEAGKIYRSSRFPYNHRGMLNGKMGVHPASSFSDEAFNFLRAHNIRTVVSLENEKETYAMKGYFDSLAPQKGFRIRVVSYPVTEKLTYSRDTRERHGGLRRAIQFIDFIKTQQEPGAVLLLGDSGKDAVGVVAAAYELWRNVGNTPRDALWNQVKERYLVSDVLIKRDLKAMKVSSKTACKDPKYSFVCPETIEAMRPDLERIAQMD